jgi:hypothetical protein
MSDSCPTVKIVDKKAPGGYVVINEEDFDETQHKLYVEPVEKVEKIEAPQPAKK